MSEPNTGRYPQWQIDMFRNSTGHKQRPSKDDEDAAMGRSILENDAIQQEHRELTPSDLDDLDWYLGTGPYAQ